MQPPYKLRNAKSCSDSSFTVIECSRNSEGSDQTAHMRRLVRVFAGRAYHIVENLMSRLISYYRQLLKKVMDRSLFSEYFVSRIYFELAINISKNRSSNFRG